MKVMSKYEIEPGQPWVVDGMRPEDAPGVTMLFRSVYGDDYPIRTYIQPDLLIEENRAHRILSSVARTPKGDIVGHNALFHSAPSETIFESGSGLVHRDYRGGSIFQQMILHGQKRIAEEFQAAAVWGEPVLNHPFSQKCTRSVGWRTLAVEVDLMPAAAYAKEKSAYGRVSTLMDFYPLHPRPHDVFLPPVYEESLRTLYQSWPPSRGLSPSTDAPGEGSFSRIVPQVFSFARVVRMAVHRVGTDFEAVFAAMEQNALGQGVDVLQAWLRLTDPAVGWAVNRLRARGYFFGGLLPRWFDDDGMLMQKTVHPPHWDTMQIVYDEGRMVADMARRDWEEIRQNPS